MAHNNDLSNYSSRERGILSTASKWKMTAGRQTLSQNYTNAWIIQEIKDGHIAEERVWELVLNDPNPQWVKCDSGALGIFSTIGDYENKKGEISKAHYTVNNKYLGSVKKLGDKPISYEGNFQFNDYKEHFEFYLNQEANMNVLDFFRVKENASSCSSCSDMFVEAPIKKPILIDDDNDDCVKCGFIHDKDDDLCDSLRVNGSNSPVPVAQPVPEAPKKKKPTVAKPKKPVVGDE